MAATPGQEVASEVRQAFGTVVNDFSAMQPEKSATTHDLEVALMRHDLIDPEVTTGLTARLTDMLLASPCSTEQKWKMVFDSVVRAQKVPGENNAPLVTAINCMGELAPDGEMLEPTFSRHYNQLWTCVTSLPDGSTAAVVALSNEMVRRAEELVADPNHAVRRLAIEIAKEANSLSSVNRDEARERICMLASALYKGAKGLQLVFKEDTRCSLLVHCAIRMQDAVKAPTNGVRDAALVAFARALLQTAMTRQGALIAIRVRQVACASESPVVQQALADSMRVIIVPLLKQTKASEKATCLEGLRGLKALGILTPEIADAVQSCGMSNSPEVVAEATKTITSLTAGAGQRHEESKVVPGKDEQDMSDGFSNR